MSSAPAVPAVDYEIVIGLEVHSQLLTRSKMFCSCAADYANAEPNSHTCPTCMGYPGVLPVINQQAVDYTIMTALALNCEIPDFSKFDRKNYFYPDLPKGYQISQYDRPLSRNGFLMIEHNGEERRIGVTRVHLEEDTGRLRHENAFGLLFSLNMLIENHEGAEYTGADCQGWMRDVGFTETYVEPVGGGESMVVGFKRAHH